jgi:hypothetical protein
MLFHGLYKGYMRATGLKKESRWWTAIRSNDVSLQQYQCANAGCFPRFRHALDSSGLA